MTRQPQNIPVMHVCLCGEIQHVFHTYLIYMNAKMSSAPRSEKGLIWP